MAQRSVKTNLVHIVAACPCSNHIARLHQILHDAVNRSFADADQTGDLSETDLRVLAQAHQHMSMIGKKSPRGNLDRRTR